MTEKRYGETSGGRIRTESLHAAPARMRVLCMVMSDQDELRNVIRDDFCVRAWVRVAVCVRAERAKEQMCDLRSRSGGTVDQSGTEGSKTT